MGHHGWYALLSPPMMIFIDPKLFLWFSHVTVTNNTNVTSKSCWQLLWFLGFFGALKYWMIKNISCFSIAQDCPILFHIVQYCSILFSYVQYCPNLPCLNQWFDLVLQGMYTYLFKLRTSFLGKAAQFSFLVCNCGSFIFTVFWKFDSYSSKTITKMGKIRYNYKNII